MAIPRVVPAALAGAVVALLAACAPEGVARAADALGPARGTPGATTTAAAAPLAAPEAPAAAMSSTPEAPVAAMASAPPPAPSTRTLTATMSIPAIGLTGLSVVPYEGTTDDWPGTRIQNRGIAASPYGPSGGVGPGEVGNYLVTAHRLSAGGPLRELPSLKNGDTVVVTAGGLVYEYEITATRKTSFRSPESLAAQRAAVPGHPGQKPVKAMITISTCATPEDDAEGNFWRDDRGNPEHRIDKIGVLSAPPRPASSP